MPAIVCEKGTLRQDGTSEEKQANLVVWATLTSREHSIVDALLEVLIVLAVFPEEDHTCSGATKRLVTKWTQSRPKANAWGHSRCGGDNITILKRVVQFLRCDQPACVSDIRHHISALPVTNGLDRGVIPVSGISGSTADNQTGLENLCLLGQGLVIDELRRRVKSIRERLEIDRRRSHLFLRRLCKTGKQAKQTQGFV